MARPWKVVALGALLVLAWNLESLEFGSLIGSGGNGSAADLWNNWMGTAEVYHVSTTARVERIEGEDTSAVPVVEDNFEELIRSHHRAANLSRAVLCQNWEDRELEKRLAGRCSFYLMGMEQWAEHAASTPERIVGWQQRSGTGDRLAGLVSVFHYAFTIQKRVQLKWSALDAVFEPSCVMRKMLEIDGNATGWRHPKPDCTEHSCPAARRTTDVCKPGEDLHLVDKQTVIRGCTSAQRCRNLEHWIGAPSTMVETAGCPLRLMFEPRASFLDAPVQYFADGAVHTGTLREVVRLVKSYKTIALHYRTGDGAMTKKHAHGISESNMGYTTKCMGWVDDMLAQRGGDEDDREVRWVVASDNENLRRYFRETYPNKTIILMAPPEHISKSHSDDKVQSTINIFSEFYLLGQADELVVSQSKYRMSAFSKFAWLYNLKSHYYAIRYRFRTCLLKEMEYDGNTATFPSQCSTNPSMGKFSDFSIETHSWKYSFPKKPLPQLHNPEWVKAHPEKAEAMKAEAAQGESA